MSSWGWGSKFSNLLAVSDFSIFGPKSSHLQDVILKFWVFFFFNFRLGILKDAQVPDSFDGITIGRCVHHIFILKVWFPIKKTAAKPLAERSEANSRFTLGRVNPKWTPEGYCRYGAKINRGCYLPGTPSHPTPPRTLRLNSLKNKKKRWLDIKFKILFKILCLRKKWHFWNLK